MMAVLLTCLLAFELCGCSALGAPATTEELLVRYVANENVDNYRAKVDVGLSINALGVRAAIPISCVLSTANRVAHGTIKLDLSSLDTRNYEMEFYAELLDDAVNFFIGAPGKKGTRWKLWAIDTTSKIDIFTVTELLEAAELTMIAKDSDEQVCYELSVPMEKVLATAFDITADPAEVGGMDEQGMMDAVSNDKVRVGFNEDCLMRSLDTGLMLTFKSPETNNVEVRTEVDVSETIDDYGKVDLTEVAIPSEVREEAVPTDEPVDVIEIIGADSPLAGAVGGKERQKG